MKRLIPALLGLVAMTGCTNGQISRWLDWYHEDPDAAVEFANRDWVQDSLHQRVEGQQAASSSSASDDQHDGDEGADNPPRLSGACSQWSGMALDVGWSQDQWSTLSRIMYRESRCDPGAHNPSGATGLLQIMPGWADDCGGSPSDLYGPWFNLSCGLHVLHAQGWSAWSTY